MVMKFFFFLFSFLDYYYMQGGMIVKNIESGARLFGFKAQLCHLLTHPSWVTFNKLLNLSVLWRLICKNEDSKSI